MSLATTTRQHTITRPAACTFDCRRARSFQTSTAKYWFLVWEDRYGDEKVGDGASDEILMNIKPPRRILHSTENSDGLFEAIDAVPSV
jgi:hypothetical protein